jgi:hypothetical protein
MSRLLAHDGAGFNVEANRIMVHDDFGFNVEAPRAWAFDGLDWVQIYPGEGTEPPPSGTVILGPISQNLTGSSGFSDYNTSAYRGRILEIRARVSWVPQTFCIAGLVTSVEGRPNLNFYRNITSDDQWCGRTIDHRIDSFDATSLTDFNSGVATGFRYNAAGLALENMWSNVALNLTIS